MNHLTFGPNSVEYDLTGYTIAQAEQALSEVLNIGSWVPAFVEGKRVESKSKFVLHRGQAVLFWKVWGIKGAGRRKLLEEQVVELQDRIDRLEDAVYGLLDVAGDRIGTPKNGSRKSPYLNSEEAAEYLRTSISSLYGLVDRKQINPLRGPKRSYRFTPRMLDDYLRGRNNDR